MTIKGKARFKKMLSKGLSGWEAGRLILQEASNRVRGKEELSYSDISTIKMSLKTPEDKEIYNHILHTGSWLEIHRHLALSGGLMAAIHLLRAHLFLKDCILDKVFKEEGPLLVTQKQYEELRDTRKKELLQKTWTLQEVIRKRLEYLDSQTSYTMTDSWDDTEDTAEFIEFVKMNYPHVWEQTLAELAFLLQESKLSPLDQEGKPITKVLSIQDLESLQEEAFLSGESLYGAGLPEWTQELDTYRVEGREVAIVQGAEPPEIDKNGHYRDLEKETEEDWKKEGLPGRGPAEWMAWYYQQVGTSLTQVIQGAVRVATAEFLDFLAAKTAIDEFYEVMGAKPPFSLEEVYQDFLLDLEAFNRDLKHLRVLQELRLREQGPALIIDPSNIELIEPEQLKPDSSEVQEERNRIAAYGIGKGWWKRRKRAKPEETEGEGEESSLVD
jgi:hypothetical protein